MKRQKSVEDATAALLATSAKKRRASRSGLTGEQIVAAYNDVAHAGGVALLTKVPTATRRVKRGTTWGIAYVAKSTVDYVGIFLDGSARFVAVEVKRCSSAKRFRLGEVEPHQAAYLRAVAHAGGVALLVVVYGPENRVCVFEWTAVEDHISLGPAEMDAHAVDAAHYLRAFVRERHVHGHQHRDEDTSEVIR